MRASEALMLGAMELKPMRGSWSDENGGGCALTMIKQAGVSLQALLTLVKVPCGCYAQDFQLSHAVMHLFDYHVRAPHYLDESVKTPLFLKLFGIRNYVREYQPAVPPFWTIEQIAQWLETVEPRAEDKELRDLIQTIADEPISQALAADYVGYDSEGCYISVE
jgi:hypothetical protein